MNQEYGVLLICLILALLAVLCVFWQRTTGIEKMGLVVLLALAVTWLFFPNHVSAAETSFWVEGQVTRSGSGEDRKNVSQVNGGLSGSLNDTFGYYGFAQTLSNGYRQIYVGPNLKPFPWLELGVGVGKENAPASNRRNAYFLADNGKCSLFGAFENGGSGAFHKVVFNCRVSDSLGVGLMDQEFLGFGPRMEYSLNKNLLLWGGVLRDNKTKTTNATFALTYNF